tara:strand:- start:431 stop:622 length:192 start_codon:yes stop_codon:yes gene_type:complete
MQLEYTITDQILLTWGTGESRTVLRTWHISQKDEAEAELKRVLGGTSRKPTFHLEEDEIEESE